MILENRVRDLLEENRFPGTRRRHDEPPLAFPDRCEEIHHSHRQIGVLRLQVDTCVGIEGCEVFEQDLVLRVLGIVEVDLLDLEQCEVAFPFLRRPDLSENGIAGVEVEPLDLRGGDIDVVRTVEIVPVLRAQKAVPFRQDLEYPFSHENDRIVEKTLFDLEYEFLFPEIGVVVQVEIICHLMEVPDGSLLDVVDAHHLFLEDVLGVVHRSIHCLGLK